MISRHIETTLLVNHSVSGDIEGLIVIEKNVTLIHVLIVIPSQLIL